MEAFSRLWRTVTELRKLNDAAPKMAKAAAARHAEVANSIQQQAQQSASASESLAQAVTARLEAASAEQDAQLAARSQALEKALSSVAIDPTKAQQRAVGACSTAESHFRLPC